jgi:crossover junction endodeoxyribonuclease RusA
VYELDVPLVVFTGRGVARAPLSLNDRTGWRARAKHVRQIREAIAWQAKKIGPCGHITAQLHYAPGDQRRRDASNLMASQKPAVDGLVDAGVVSDDTAEYVTELMPVIHPGPGPRRLWLTVTVTRIDEEPMRA